MKKIIIAGLFFILSSVNVYAMDLQGEWLSKEGVKERLEQSGDTFSLIIADDRLAEYLGVASVKGTITGSTFTGWQYYVTDECPNLEGYVPARGTVTEEKIESTFTGFRFYPETCTKDLNSVEEDNASYSRVPTPSPTITPTPSFSLTLLTPTPTPVPERFFNSIIKKLNKFVIQLIRIPSG